MRDRLKMTPIGYKIEGPLKNVTNLVSKMRIVNYQLLIASEIMTNYPLPITHYPNYEFQHFCL